MVASSGENPVSQREKSDALTRQKPNMGQADVGALQEPCIVQSSIGNDENVEIAITDAQIVLNAIQEQEATPPKTSKRFKKSTSTTVSPGEQRGPVLSPNPTAKVKIYVFES